MLETFPTNDIFPVIKKHNQILIVEDNDFDYELIERKLKKMSFSYETKRAADAKEFEDILYNYAPDIILSDFSIPSYNGLKALKFAKSLHAEVPFIFVSGSIGEDLAVEALKQGADDYVLKDNLNKLEPSVKRALQEAREKIKRKEAENKLKIKNHELRTLVYRISHDIKGPICTMQGAIHLSQIAENKEECLVYLNAMEKVTTRLDGIIKNLSNFQYVFADEPQISLAKLDELLQKVQKSISSVDDLQQVKIEFQTTGEQEVYCEQNFLFFILYNLIHNAIVFSDTSKPWQKVNCMIKHCSNGLTIKVEDNGMGIPEKIKERVCEMFYRGNPASKGAGLGLYIVKTCTDLLNGNLEINSTEYSGTSISISLPHPASKNGQFN